MNSETEDKEGVDYFSQTHPRIPQTHPFLVSERASDETSIGWKISGLYESFFIYFLYILDKRKSSVKAGLVLSVRQISNYTVKTRKTSYWKSGGEIHRQNEQISPLSGEQHAECVSLMVLFGNETFEFD